MDYLLDFIKDLLKIPFQTVSAGDLMLCNLKYVILERKIDLCSLSILVKANYVENPC